MDMTTPDETGHEMQHLSMNIEKDAIDPALDPVLRVIKRLEEVVDQETSQLLAGASVDMGEINNRKSRGLHDFNKAVSKAAQSVDAFALKSLQPFLDGLKQKLDSNCEALKLHLSAMTELAELIRGALETHETDGTYTAHQLRASGQGA